jgi:formamidopyrimidine-DNA glycosylase
MPELPEVETTLRGISPHILHKTVKAITFYAEKLRWPLPHETVECLPGQKLNHISRRSKYIIMEFDSGSMMVHLGMSGSLSIETNQQQRDLQSTPKKHDHVELHFSDGTTLRYNDPRRFGSWLWQADKKHPELDKLGPEPLTLDFTAEHLFTLSQSRKRAIKNQIMDNQVVVGVGNIYATEALFHSGIHPNTPCNLLTLTQMNVLVKNIQDVLGKAIKQGGTTLKDFSQADGKPGYFAQQLEVYGRAGKPCNTCKATIEKMVLGQRTSAFCPTCQPE